MNLNIFLLSLVALVSCKNQANNTGHSAITENASVIETEVKKSISEVNTKAPIIEKVTEKEMILEEATSKEVMNKVTETKEIVTNTEVKEEIAEVEKPVIINKVKETSQSTIDKSNTKIEESSKLASNSIPEVKSEKPAAAKVETKKAASASSKS